MHDLALALCNGSGYGYNGSSSGSGFLRLWSLHCTVCFWLWLSGSEMHLSIIPRCDYTCCISLWFSLCSLNLAIFLLSAGEGEAAIARALRGGCLPSETPPRSDEVRSGGLRWIWLLTVLVGVEIKKCNNCIFLRFIYHESLSVTRSQITLGLTVRVVE